MKKIFTFALSLITVGALTGCSSKEGDNGQDAGYYEDEAYDIPDDDDEYEFIDHNGINMPDGDYYDECFEVDEVDEFDDDDYACEFDAESASIDEIFDELDRELAEFHRLARGDGDLGRLDELSESMTKLLNNLVERSPEMSTAHLMRLMEFTEKIENI